MKALQKLLTYSTFFISFSAIAEIKSDEDLTITPVTTGMNVVWGIDVLPDNSLLVTNREAKLFHVADGKNVEIKGLPADILVENQGGLFDVALPPDYAESGWIYISYNKGTKEKGTTTLARAKLKDKQLIDWEDIFVAKAVTGETRHYGGRIAFDGKGHLFLSVGDRGVRPNGQDLTTHAGTILRLNMDGTAPKDNPFVDRDDALPEIWSYGHRNPQGLFFNQQTGQLWEMEHGPRGGDEINLIQAGKNYGWAEISHGKEYWGPIKVGSGTEQEGMENAVKVYVPSIAPSGLVQYQGDLFPSWKGKLISGALALQHLNLVTVDAQNEATDEQRLLDTLNRRIREVIEAPDGALLIGTDSGEVYRITPAQ